MDIRTCILEAATKVYGALGYRGATTRRIAQEAGVNELTLFRHFGSKEALIHEAVRCCGPEAKLIPLPDEPVDPYAELLAWASTHHATIRKHGALIRTTLAEIDEHPELISPNDPYALAYEQLAGYVRALQRQGRADAAVEPLCVAAMLLNALLLNGIMRDVMPQMMGPDPDSHVDQFVRNFLRAVGAPVPAHT
ncbi:MAG TPA: helix-turn-helix domain-containing protein [Gemmatimonadales bacterium]|nr:helix-turn-helix domain-containing protein [Gemmatimonadales bacterium]HVX89061.1 helix-turn-helix domain-containing protein [Gemmatimonadales bacterium]